MCAEVQKGSIWPVGGPVENLTTIDSRVTRCKNARPLAGSDAYVWVEYGDGVSPANRVRFTDGAGRSIAGDAFARGGPQVWGPAFVDGGRAVVAIYGAGGSVGPLHRIDRETGADEPIGNLDASYPFATSDAVAVGANGPELHWFDVAARTSRVLFAFPSFGAPGCATGGASTDASCFLRPREPSIDAKAQYVAFIGRGESPFTTDTDGDVFLLRVADGTLRRLTDDTVRERSPRLTRDGTWVYWIQDDARILRTRTDGTSAIETWLTHPIRGTLSLGEP